jgi:hypothetical protein
MPGMMELPSHQLIPNNNNNHMAQRNIPQQSTSKQQAPDQASANSVKVPTPQVKKSQWADISEYDEVNDLVYIFVSSIVGVMVVVLMARVFPELFGKNLNIFFNRFKLLGIAGYVLMLMIILGASRYIYSEFLFMTYDWNPTYFTGVAVLSQIAHDLLCYYLVLTQVPKGSNSVIDVLKEYAESGGSRIIFGNTLLISFVSVLSMVLKGTPAHIVSVVGVLSAYVIPFMLEARNEFSTIS